MSDPLENFWDGVRKKARAVAYAKKVAEIRGRRKAEKRLKKEGRAPAFSGLVAADVERLKKSGEFDTLVEDEDFRARVEQLEAELASAMDDVKEAEDAALLSAMASIPEDLEMMDRHKKENDLLLQQSCVDSIDEATTFVQERYRELRQQQKIELEQVLETVQE